MENQADENKFVHDIEHEISQEVYNKCEERDTLLDYFGVIGLEEASIAEVIDRYPLIGDISIQQDLIQLKPALLSRFPPQDKKDFPIDETVVAELPNYAFPLGYQIIEATEQPPMKQLPMIFEAGLFLIFYEDIDNYRECQAEYKSNTRENQNTQQKGNIPQASDMTAYTDNLRVQPSESRDNRVSNIFEIKDEYLEQRDSLFDKVSRQLSPRPQTSTHADSSAISKQTSDDKREEMRERKNSKTYQIDTNVKKSEVGVPMTPLVKNQDTLNYNKSQSNIVSTPQLRQKGSALKQQTQVAKLYIPKAICILSRYPFYDAYAEILEDIYLASKNGLENPIEAYINKLVLDCPAPHGGITKLLYKKYSQPDSLIEISQPPVNQLPFINYSYFQILFKTLTPEHIITIFTNLILEKSVLIVSKEIEILVPITQSLQNLLYPFQWVQCIPWIGNDPDDEEMHNLNVIVSPFLSSMIGIHEGDFDRVKQILQTNDKEGPLICNIGEQKYCVSWATVLMDGYALRHHKNAKNVDSVKLPDQLYNQLLSSIKSALKNENIKEISKEATEKIRNAFFNVMLELFEHYKQKDDTIKKKQDDSLSFDVKKFIQLSSSKYRNFYKELFKDNMPNQMFTNFLTESSMTSQEDLKIMKMHFDECILRMQNHSIAPYKPNMPILDDKIKQQVEYAPAVSSVNFTSDQLIQLYYQKFGGESQSYFIPFETNKNGEQLFQYKIFPKMKREIYENRKILILDNLTQSLINSQNHKYIYKSMLQRLKVKIPQVNECEGTYVYLSWIYMWCGTLWMQDEQEKFFRFMQVLQVLARLKTNYIQRPGLDLFYLLIEASYHHGTMRMTQKIYDTLSSYGLQPNAKILTLYARHLKMSSKAAKKEQQKQQMGAINQQLLNANKLQKKPTLFTCEDQKQKNKDAQILNPDSRLYQQVKYAKQFRKRTFKTCGDATIIFDEVKMKLQEVCTSCGGQLLPAQIRSAIEKIQKDKKIIQAQCTYCGKEIEQPQLKIMIGKRLQNVKGKSYKEENTVFLSALQLYKIVETIVFESEDMKVDFEALRFNKQIFWNLIYYFSDYSIPYDFLLSYEDSFAKEQQLQMYKRMQSKGKVYMAENDLDEVQEEHEENDDHHRDTTLNLMPVRVERL